MCVCACVGGGGVVEGGGYTCVCVCVRGRGVVRVGWCKEVCPWRKLPQRAITKLKSTHELCARAGACLSPLRNVPKVTILLFGTLQVTGDFLTVSLYRDTYR